jgi:hypothetical protein
MIGSILLALLVNSQAPIVVSSPVQVDWFSRVADISTFAVSRYEVQTNFGGFGSVGMPISGSIPDWSKFSSQVDVGTVYRVDIRACNIAFCGPAYVRAPLLQQPPIVTPADRLAWDYTDEMMANAAIQRFEVQYDNGPFTSVGIPTETQAVTGGKTYKVAFPTLPPGPHTANVRACNTEVCGQALGPLGFALAQIPVPPTNLRVIKGG